MARNAQAKNAKGYKDKHDRVQIGVRLGKAAFFELKRQAIKDNLSIAQKIRDYIEICLDIDHQIQDPDITTFEGVS